MNKDEVGPQEELFSIQELVQRLVGPIMPVGESHTDGPRLQNLYVMIDLVDKLLTDIDRVASCKHRIEYSMRKAGETASAFYDRLGISE